MRIVGCDFHPSYQQVAVLDTESSEVEERSLTHANGEAERFYRDLTRGALVGMEAVGNSQWFVGLVERLGHQVWIGDAAQIRASYIRKQKTDRFVGIDLAQERVIRADLGTGQGRSIHWLAL